MKPIILASTSPYRKLLLEKINIKFSSIAPDINESIRQNESAKQLSLRLAQEKAYAVKHLFKNHLIIGSDQTVSCGNIILGKPGDYNSTVDQLKLQSGKVVSFYTSVCVLDSGTGKMGTELDICTVYFKKLSEQQIINYVTLEKPYQCAGGFKSEGLGIALFNKIEGDDPNALIGLPLIKLISLLQKMGVEIL